MAANKTTNVLLGLILVLLVLNLAMTTILVGKLATENDADDRLDPEIAGAWGDNVVELYNRRDHEALYRLFSSHARVKFSEQQFAGQLEKLFQLFGSIDGHTFINSVKLGEKAEDSYYQLFYQARVSAKDNPATLKLSLIVSNGEVSLYGFSINASESLD